MAMYANKLTRLDLVMRGVLKIEKHQIFINISLAQSITILRLLFFFFPYYGTYVTKNNNKKKWLFCGTEFFF